MLYGFKVRSIVRIAAMWPLVTTYVICNCGFLFSAQLWYPAAICQGMFVFSIVY